MAKYIKELQTKRITLVPVAKVNHVCKEAEKVGINVYGGAFEKTRRGMYQWLYTEAA